MSRLPLLTESEARERALALLKQYDRDPDCLSPDEQALAMTIRMLERATRDVIEVMRGGIVPRGTCA